jgi:hypothetical protein
MPNHMPRTLRRPPRERAEFDVAPGRGEPNAGVSVVVLDASIVLDNGVSGELAATPP